MGKKQVRKWQFVENGKVMNGQVEIDQETFEALQNGLIESESERRRLFDYYDRVAKWRFHHPPLAASGSGQD